MVDTLAHGSLNGLERCGAIELLRDEIFDLAKPEKSTRQRILDDRTGSIACTVWADLKIAPELGEIQRRHNRRAGKAGVAHKGPVYSEISALVGSTNGTFFDGKRLDRSAGA